MFLDQLAEPSVRERIFTIVDALIGDSLLLYCPVEAEATPKLIFAGTVADQMRRKIPIGEDAYFMFRTQ